MRISLLHATRGEPTRANATRVTWLDRAEEPHLIQHIWAVQEGDQSAADLCADSELVKTDDPPDWASSSVANWNAAAALATGDLLIVIADDLSPPLAWDYILRRAIIDPSKEFAVFVADQLANDGLLRHPILSRGLYSRRGYVFDPDYYGVFCDNDLTVWCDVNEVPVMRLRPEVLRWFHDHDMVAAVTAQQNRAEAYKYGETIFRRKWAAMIPRRVTETHSVWIGRNLSRMERLCLTLLVRHDHNPTLWVQRDLFEDYDGLPDGVNVLFVPDAYLPPVPFRGIPHPTIPNGGHGSFAQWSDWFAVYILSVRPGALWCQLDIAAIEPIYACENTFTTFSGGISVCAFTLRRDLAWQCHEAMASMVHSGMVGLDWHDTMRLVENVVAEAGVLTTSFAGYYDCGGRKFSPFNLPLDPDNIPKLIHWSNATHGYSKNDPIPGTLYAKLVQTYL